MIPPKRGSRAVPPPPQLWLLSVSIFVAALLCQVECSNNESSKLIKYQHEPSTFCYLFIWLFWGWPQTLKAELEPLTPCLYFLSCCGYRCVQLRLVYVTQGKRTLSFPRARLGENSPNWVIALVCNIVFLKNQDKEFPMYPCCWPQPSPHGSTAPWLRCVLFPLPIKSMTSGKPVHLSVPQFPFLLCWDDDIIAFTERLLKGLLISMLKPELYTQILIMILFRGS